MIDFRSVIDAPELHQDCTAWVPEFTRLTRLLLEATGVATEERDDDGR